MFGFEAYGVKIGVEFSHAELLTEFRGILPQVVPLGFTEINLENAVHRYKVSKEKKSLYTLAQTSEPDLSFTESRFLFERLESAIRINIAGHAREHVFLHAGVVGWKGQAIVIPAKSFKGKTTLVSELIKKGAEYYSDECAVLDKDGLVHPFPKTLSMRGIIDQYRQIEMPAGTFGGKIGREPIPVGLVLFTEYEPGSRWQPQILKTGEAMMETLPHTMTITISPEFTLGVLNKMLSRAVSVKTKRGDADEVVELILQFSKKQVSYL